MAQLQAHSPSRPRVRTFCAVAATLLLASCGGGGTASSESAPEPVELSAAAALGEKIFHDPSLSASGRQSCASCHDAAFGHSPPNSLAAQFGGADLDLQGTRKAPGIRYLRREHAVLLRRRRHADRRLLLGRPRAHLRRAGDRAVHQSVRDGQRRQGRGRRQARGGAVCRRLQAAVRRRHLHRRRRRLPAPLARGAAVRARGHRVQRLQQQVRRLPARQRRR